MELAGLKIRIDGDMSPLVGELAKANSVLEGFSENIKSAFNSIPNFKGKFNFTSNGASQAAQDAREYARAARETAEAEKARIQAQIAQQREQDRQNNKSKQAKDTYGELVAESNALVRAYYNEAAAQLKASEATEEGARKLEELRKAAYDSQQALAKIEQGAGRFQRNVGNYASGFSPLTNSITQITREFPAFANSIQTGLLGISNNIGPLADSIRQIIEQNKLLIAQGQPTKSVFSQLASAVFSWQTALSFGITALTIYGPKLYELITNTEGAAEAQKALKETQDALNNAEKNATKSATEQINKLKTLQDTMTNSNLTMQQRYKAYDEAKKLYPSYLEHVSRDQALNGGLADVLTNKLIPAIIAAAKARAYQEKINILTSKNIDLEQQHSDLILERIKHQNRLRIATQNAQNVTEDKEGAGLRSAVKKDIKEAKSDIDDLTTAINNNAKARIANRSQIDEMANSLQKELEIAGKIGIDGEDIAAGGKAAKEIRTLNDLQSELIKKNNEADASLKAGAATVEEVMKQKADNYRKYIIDALSGNFALTVDSKPIKDAQLAINKLSTTTLPSQGFQKLNVEISKLGPVSIRSFDEFRQAYERADIEGQAKRAQERWSESIEQFKVDLLNSLRDVKVGLLEGFGTLFGEILAGGQTDPFGRFLKGLGALLGDQIVALGKQLIVAGGLMEAAKKAIAALGINPAIAPVIGAALVAGGAALKAVLSKQAKGVGRVPMASGGIVYGPTNALVGEYTGANTNPEVVAPLDKLKNILGTVGGDIQVFIPDLRIQGSDLVVAFRRAEKAYNR